MYAYVDVCIEILCNFCDNIAAISETGEVPRPVEGAAETLSCKWTVLIVKVVIIESLSPFLSRRVMLTVIMFLQPLIPTMPFQ
jgi:hypothetical protein